ncbi:MAG: HNH endonuclease family protein [Sporocytophaga sp.]|nr:HNH endonuclease family protein [Sporocytophaga sp.]
MLTALHSGYSDIEGLKFSLRRFYYLYWIAGKTLTAVKQTSFNLIGAIKDKKTLTEINTILDEKIISDKIIGSVNQNIYGNIYYEPWAKALFLMIEYNHMEESFSTFYGIDKHLQLEHILPQSFTSREEWNYFNKEIGQKLLHTAGNLTLLYSKKNIEAKNYSFDDKMQIYQGFGKDNNKKDGITSFRISQKIVDDFCKGEFVQWTSEEIKDRGAWFITEIEEILKFELPKKIELQP